MKYKLKRNIFTSKAGEKVEIRKGSLKYPHFTIEFQPDEGLIIWIKDIRLLLDDGWIEEVKPREWTLEITKDSHYIRPPDAAGKLYDSNSEVIKVREILED